MKKLILLVTTLLMSATSFAGVETMHSNTSHVTPVFSTKAEAYDAGFNYIDQLNSMSKSQLRNQLSLFSYTSVNHIQLDNSKVVIEEFAQSPGHIAYRAVVNMDYQFTAYESTN